MLSVVIGFAACQSKNVELSPLAMLNFQFGIINDLSFASSVVTSYNYIHLRNLSKL